MRLSMKVDLMVDYLRRLHRLRHHLEEVSVEHKD
jgi:hypothetical protein